MASNGLEKLKICVVCSSNLQVDRISENLTDVTSLVEHEQILQNRPGGREEGVAVRLDQSIFIGCCAQSF